MTTYAGRAVWPQPFMDRRGNKRAGLVVTVYEAGTTTPATLYTDRTKATELPSNSTTTDAAGNLWVYLDPGDYDAWVDGTIIPFSVVPDAADVGDTAGLPAHLADPTDAHDASAVSFVPTGTIAATNVQDAIVEALAEAVGAVTSVDGQTGAVDLSDNYAGTLDGSPMVAAPAQTNYYCPVATGVAATDTANLQAFLNSLAAVPGSTGWIPSPPAGLSYVTNADLLLSGAVDVTIYVGAGAFISPSGAAITGLKLLNCLRTAFPSGALFTYGAGCAVTRMMWLYNSSRTRIPMFVMRSTANLPAPTATTWNGSQGALPLATIALVSTASFPAASASNPQTAYVVIPNGLTSVTYTGIAGNTLTGCTGGAGTPVSGAAVTAGGVVGIDLDVGSHWSRVLWPIIRQDSGSGSFVAGVRMGSGGNGAGSNAQHVVGGEFDNCAVGALCDGTASSWIHEGDFELGGVCVRITEQPAYQNSSIRISSSRPEAMNVVDIQQVTPEPNSNHTVMVNGQVNSSFFTNPNGIPCGVDSYGPFIAFERPGVSNVLVRSGNYPKVYIAQDGSARLIYNTDAGAGHRWNIDSVNYLSIGDTGDFRHSGDKAAVNGRLPVVPPSLGAAATDPATTMALVNAIRACLIAAGWATA